MRAVYHNKLVRILVKTAIKNKIKQGGQNLGKELHLPTTAAAETRDAQPPANPPSPAPQNGLAQHVFPSPRGLESSFDLNAGVAPFGGAYLYGATPYSRPAMSQVGPGPIQWTSGRDFGKAQPSDRLKELTSSARATREAVMGQGPSFSKVAEEMWHELETNAYM